LFNIFAFPPPAALGRLLATLRDAFGMGERYTPSFWIAMAKIQHPKKPMTRCVALLCDIVRYCAILYLTS
jgi:hypothetical protein